MAMTVTLSAVKGFDLSEKFESCNEDISQADAFAVYIDNPKPFLVKYFFFNLDHLTPKVELRKRALDQTSTYAERLAKHLGCEMLTLPPGYDIAHHFASPRKLFDDGHL